MQEDRRLTLLTSPFEAVTILVRELTWQRPLTTTPITSAHVADGEMFIILRLVELV